MAILIRPTLGCGWLFHGGCREVRETWIAGRKKKHLWADKANVETTVAVKTSACYVEGDCTSLARLVEIKLGDRFCNPGAVQSGTHFVVGSPRTPVARSRAGWSRRTAQTRPRPAQCRLAATGPGRVLHHMRTLAWPSDENRSRGAGRGRGPRFRFAVAFSIRTSDVTRLSQV